MRLWFASGSAEICAASREFAVVNCTACPKLDHTRGDVQMANCTGNGTAYKCLCLDYPHPGTAPPLVYYPHVEGNVTRCASAWETAPQLNTALVVVGGCAQLYAAAHLLYIVVLSGMCSRKQHTRQCDRCTKHSGSALSLCIMCVCWFSICMWTIVAQGEVAIGKVWLGYHIVFYTNNICMDVFGVLFYTSVCDVVFSEDNEACQRRSINTTFWTLLGTSVVLVTFDVFGYLLGADQSWTSAARQIGGYFRSFSFMFSLVFMVIAHKNMRKAVREHAEQNTKDPFVIKMDGLCSAICRFYYPFWGVVVVSSFAWFARPGRTLYPCPGNSAVDPMTYWVLEIQFAFGISGVGAELFACVLESKPYPTFPWRCFGHQSHSQSAGSLSPMGSSGFMRALSVVQFTPMLGKAVALLTKHGLDTERREEFPVEVAMESLLSTSPLMVAATPDTDLMSCVEHFLNHCTDDKGQIAPKFAELSVGDLLKGGWKQHVLTTDDIPKLRDKAKKCLKWARDPARPPIANTTVDEAAAIQLYTQHCCVYPLLNAALRDQHSQREHLEAFLPYLKLLLKGLNKLPLIRKQVYRGVNLDLHEEYNQLQGRTFHWWAFTSTTQRESLSAAFAGQTGGSTLFQIDGIGVDIAAFSAFPREDEVLLLPGTCLVVEPGVMVNDKCWEFQASVWDAVQQELQQYHHHHQQQHSEAKDEGGAEGELASSLPSRPSLSGSDLSLPGVDGNHVDGHRESKPQFQKTDLPHPGWEQLVYSTVGVQK